MADREKVIKGLECLAKRHGIVGVCEPESCPYGDLHTCANEIARDVLTLLKAQEPVSPNGEQYQCNKCKFYQGVHNFMGHAPCSFWNIGGVMWDDYCSHFSHDENDLGTCRATLHKDAITLSKAQEPVVHGRWLFAGGHFTCSECGYGPLNEVIFRGVSVWWKDIREEMIYCPHCGAKMDGEAEPWTS